MTLVVYDGPSSRSDPSTEFIVDKVSLVKGVPTDVPDELADELLGGDLDRLKGHKFSAADKPDEPDEGDGGDQGHDEQVTVDQAIAETQGGGSGGAKGTTGGTARGRARS